MDFDSTAVIQPDYTPQERAAYIAFQLARGASFTTYEIAYRTGITYSGAWYMMDRISRVTPVYLEAGRWRRFDP